VAPKTTSEAFMIGRQMVPSESFRISECPAGYSFDRSREINSENRLRFDSQTDCNLFRFARFPDNNTLLRPNLTPNTCYQITLSLRRSSNQEATQQYKIYRVRHLLVFESRNVLKLFHFVKCRTRHWHVWKLSSGSALSAGTTLGAISGICRASIEGWGRPNERCCRADALLCRPESRASVDGESNERVRFWRQNFS
jgi:hypothetical protein